MEGERTRIITLNHSNHLVFILELQDTRTLSLYVKRLGRPASCRVLYVLLPTLVSVIEYIRLRTRQQAAEFFTSSLSWGNRPLEQLHDL